VLRRFAISCLLAALALPAVARTRPHYGGTLRVEIEGDPWNGPDGLARQLVFDGLTRLDTNGSVQPALAVEWQSQDSDHRWQFRLRPGVQFHDGSPLTSVAVVQSFNASCANCPWTAVRAVGSSVIFTADSPMPNLPVLLAGDEFLISLRETSDGKTSGVAIGTGPFRFAGFNNDVMTFAANDACWQGRPFVDTIEILSHKPIRDQWLDLSVGRADVVEVPPEQLREAQQQRLTVLASPPVELLALQISDSGSLASQLLRASIAQAVDRSALFNVIFQKQGEIAGSLLPQELTGYSFLFPTDRNLNKSHELRGGLNPPPLTLGFEGNGAMQLAAQRIALNLREAGFDVQVVSVARQQHPDLMLRKLPLDVSAPSAAMESLLRAAGESVAVPSQTPTTLYRAERDYLERSTLVPLVDLPRAYAIGARVRDLQLRADGTPDLASASIEDAP
jgi:MarR-like DNA-binding transcriptional regulator SgrR of sgrS sRNA